MKKYLSAVLVSASLLSPVMVFAQQSDIDPQGVSCATIAHSLRYGNRDTESDSNVSILQDFLNSKGYLSTNPTGFFGKATFNAVKAFQNANGISPTGFVGNLTRAKIQQIDCVGVSTIDKKIVPTPAPAPGPAPTLLPVSTSTSVTYSTTTISTLKSENSGFSCGSVLPGEGRGYTVDGYGFVSDLQDLRRQYTNGTNVNFNLRQTGSMSSLYGTSVKVSSNIERIVSMLEHPPVEWEHMYVRGILRGVDFPVMGSCTRGFILDTGDITPIGDGRG